MDLKRLTHLVALADECHFARAAERVHLSQPAFSRSIQALEEQVGMRLFDRDSGPIKPTPAGEFVIERARRLLFDARGLQRDVELYRDHELGDLAFGAGPIAAGSLMPRVVTQLRARHPGVALRLEIGNWPRLREQLLAEDIEFYVGEVRDLPADARLEHRPLCRQLGRLLVRSGHPLAGRPCSLVEVRRFGLASVKLPQQIDAALMAGLGLRQGKDKVLAFECSDLAMLRRLALSTDVVIGATETSFGDEIAAGEVVMLDVHDMPAAHVEMAVMALANRSLSPMAERAVACIRAVVKELGLERPS